MQIELKPFIDLLHRASKVKYDEMVMVNRMLLQCYNIGIDDDIGTHYILAIPDSEKYSSEFYDQFIAFKPKKLVAVYNDGHKELLARKKELALKPKEVNEEVYFTIGDGYGEFKFIYYVREEIFKTVKYRIPYPVNENSEMVNNCVTTYESLIKRIKPGGKCVILDGNYYNLVNIALNTPQIYFHRIKMNGVKIKIPIIKSMFLGSKSWDEFYISIQESTLPNVYIFSYQLTNKGITEQFVSYIQNF